MDYQKRDEIFSKEVLTIRDVVELVECSKDKAAVLIRDWKRSLTLQGKTLRLSVEGKIHTLDYFEVMGLDPNDPGDRYCKKKDRPSANDISAMKAAHRSICV